MSDLHPQDDAGLAAFDDRLEGVVRSTARRKRTMLVGGVLLVIATAAYLGFAWWQIDSKLDAPTVVAMAEVQASPLLERPASEWAQQLEAQAPDLIDSAAAAALQAPAQLSDRVLGYVDTTVEERMPDLEERFGELVNTLVDQAADATEGDWKDGEMSDAQAKELVTSIADQFDTSLREKIDTLYAEYTGVSEELIDRLDTLAVGEGLSEKESLHRELITSFLALLQRAQAAQ